jgi:hypothetical protein
MVGVKGLDLAELFFAEFGLPALKENYPRLVDRVSAGLVGRGSDVLGADDEWSRDHGWGPRFCLFLDAEDWQAMGGEMEARLNTLRPHVFRGIELVRYRTDPITVSTIDRFYRDLAGSSQPPQSVREWAAADESALCQAQAGRVFYDPSGRLGERARAFEAAYYPDAIWKWRIASRLFRLWHYGDYNLRDRLLKRRDGVSALVGQGCVVEAAMQLAFLLNRRFAPYWKWLHWGFVRLPYLADRLEPLLTELEALSSLQGRADVIGAICDLYRDALCERGILPDRQWRNFLGSFQIVDGIEDAEVRVLIRERFDRYKHL